jgi:hypothetical protein
VIAHLRRAAWTVVAVASVSVSAAAAHDRSHLWVIKVLLDE